MAKRHPKRPRDVNELAKLITDIATGAAEDDSVAPVSPTASKRGTARAEKLSKERRSEIARGAARARWGIKGRGRPK